MAAFTIPGTIYSTLLPSRLSITHSSLHLPHNTHLSISTPNPINSSSNTTHSHPHPPHSLQNSLKPSFSNPLNPILSHPISKTLIISSPIGLLIFFVGGNGGSNNGGNGGGGGGAGGGNGGDNSWWSRFLSPQALAQDDNDGGSEDWDPHGLPDNVVVQLNKLSGFKKYKVSDILFFDKRSGTAVGTEDSFFEMVSLRPGRVYTKAQLQKEVERLVGCGMFEKVDLEGKTNPDGSIKVSINFFERIWKAAENFRCINVGLMPKLKAEEMDPDVTEKEMVDYLIRQEKDYKRRIDEARPCLLPPSVYQDVRKLLMDKGVVSARLLQQIRDSVQKWYHDEGYTYAKVVNFGNLNTKEFVCEVVEGDITQFFIQFKDKLGYVVEGNTKLPLLWRELPKQLRVGHVYNIEAGKKALRNITSLGLFSNIEVHTRHDEQNEGGIIVEIKLRELNQNSAELTTEWNIVPGPHGRPKLASLQPGGTVSFQLRNIKGLNRSLLGSVTTDNFLNPKDDFSFNFEYVHPYYDGVYDPRNRTLKTSFFNSCKLSPVFTSGPGLDEVPPIWVHRSGLKANIIENYTQQSKFTYGLVCEEITTMDDSTYITKAGQRISPIGEITDDGPPTTLSGNGVDRVVFAQANITRDDTKFVNGAIVGDRNVFLVDQGLGIGSKFPVFNRYQLTWTKFLQLKQVEEGAGKPPPPVLVLHGRHCGCVGDLPSYEAFTLGGPYSVRGYSMGELGAARFILELAAELRIPVKNTYVYAFVEHGNDLGSSKDVKGNPTRVYRKVGKGSSYGAGVKLGLVRAEYAVDHNSGTGALFFRFGERF